MGRQRGGEQRPSIGMFRVIAKFEAVGCLYDLAQVHHRDAVTDVRDRRQIVPDEYVADPKVPLKGFEQGEDMGPDRDIQG